MGTELNQSITFRENSPIDYAEEVYAFFGQFDDLTLAEVKKCCDYTLKQTFLASKGENKLFVELAQIHIKSRGK